MLPSKTTASAVTAPPLTELPSSMLLSRLRSPRLELAEAQALVAALRLRPTRTRLQASDLLRTAYQKHEKAYLAAESRVRERCERLAAKVQKDLCDKSGAAKVEAARAAALAVTRSKDLSKEAIHRDIDPRMDELRALLMPSPEQLLDADPDLRPTLDALREQHATLRGFYAAYTGVVADMIDRATKMYRLAMESEFYEPYLDGYGFYTAAKHQFEEAEVAIEAENPDAAEAIRGALTLLGEAYPTAARPDPLDADVSALTVAASEVFLATGN